MDQKQLWLGKWKRIPTKLPPTNFARRAYRVIEQGGHKTLLELGCGNGRDSIFFARKGLKVTAVDFSKSGLGELEALANKKRLTNIKTVEQDISRLKFKPNSFDVIYAHLSLHYFDDKTTKNIFHNLHSILKKGGLLFVKCKSTDDALFGQGRKIGENMYLLRDHIRHFFSKEYMLSLLPEFDTVNVRKTASIYFKYRSSFVEATAKK